VETLYTWDAEGRLVGLLAKPAINTAVNPNPVQPRPITYVYDAEGQLVREVRDTEIGTQPSAANITLYLADKNLPFAQIVEERDGAGVLKASYQFADGELIKQAKVAAPVSYFHRNHLSTGLLTDTAANVQAFYQYSAFGEQLLRGSGSFSGPPTADTIYQFAGERFNADSGLYYLRARWMDTRAGRFEGIDRATGRDRSPKSLHAYTYASADPIDANDPSGMFTMMGVSGSGLASMLNMALRVTTFIGIANAVLDEKDMASEWMASLILATTGGPAGLATGGGGSLLEAAGTVATLATEGHHTIPEYLCGARRQVLVDLPVLDHAKLHVELYGIRVAAIAGQKLVVQKILRKPTAQDSNGDRFFLGASSGGRMAIAQAIDFVYDAGDWMSRGRLPIGVVFPKERKDFERGKTSYPTCRKRFS